MLKAEKACLKPKHGTTETKKFDKKKIRKDS